VEEALETASLGSRGSVLRTLSRLNRSRRVFRHLGTAVLALALSSPAAAQEEEAPPSQSEQAMQNGGMTEERELADDRARAHYRAGRSLYDVGEFSQAAREFEAAYRLSQRPELLFNAYVAYRDANELADAVRNLGAYLDLVPDAPDRVNLQARLASMSRALEEQRAREEALAAQENGPVEPVSQPPREPAVWPWVLTGLGSAMVVTGAVTGIAALTEADSLAGECANGLCPPSVDLESRRGTVEALGIATDVLLFGGAAVALLGVVLGVALDDSGAEPDQGQPELNAACSPTGCAASLRTRF